MTLEEEMKIWEERENDIFGKTLKKIELVVEDILGTAYSTFVNGELCLYCVDGTKKTVYNRVKHYITDLDLMQYRKISNMIKVLEKNL